MNKEETKKEETRNIYNGSLFRSAYPTMLKTKENKSKTKIRTKHLSKLKK